MEKSLKNKMSTSYFGIPQKYLKKIILMRKNVRNNSWKPWKIGNLTLKTPWKKFRPWAANPGLGLFVV